MSDESKSYVSMIDAERFQNLRDARTDEYKRRQLEEAKRLLDDLVQWAVWLVVGDGWDDRTVYGVFGNPDDAAMLAQWLAEPFEPQQRSEPGELPYIYLHAPPKDGCIDVNSIYIEQRIIGEAYA